MGRNRLGTVEYTAPPPPPRGHAGPVYAGGQRRGRRRRDLREGMSRRRVDAIVRCPHCGEEVALWSGTEEWHERRGRWEHEGYSGCSQGICCGLLLVDTFDAALAYRLEAGEGGTDGPA